MKLKLVGLLLLAIASRAFSQTDYDSIYLVRNCVVLDAKESVQDERKDLLFKWTFGDGTSSNGEVVEHCYDSIGSYEVMLSIVDPYALVQFNDEWYFQVDINEDYNLSFKMNVIGNEIRAIPMLSYFEEPESVEFYWDYGDGHFGVGEESTHTYDSLGEYQVRLLAQVLSEGDIINLSQTRTIEIQLR